MLIAFHMAWQEPSSVNLYTVTYLRVRGKEHLLVSVMGISIFLLPLMLLPVVLAFPMSIWLVKTTLAPFLNES